MQQDKKLIELFSGMGGFSKGLADAGFNITEHYFAEIDKHAIANYKYNFPNAKHIGSVTDISGRDFTGIDIITFGSPCQDFSLAGKREGMDGQRSVLILEAIRLVTELRPPVFIWENVKGAFSSNNGADFWGILQAFANIGGYRLEWQLLNTKWFLPQNRERIYLVGHLAGSERSFGNVFPVSEDNCGINERSIQTRSIRTLTAGGNSGGLHSSMTLIKCKSLQGNEYSQTIRSIGRSSFTEKHSWDVIKVIQKTGGYGVTFKENETGTLQAGGANVMDKVPNILIEDRYRRLTEIECERLQGFPDDWTKYGNYDGVIKEIPKTQRYKMLGNAVTVKVVEEIAKRLLKN